MHRSSPNNSIEYRKGIIAALAAYFVWGLVPLFWKQISGISSLELMSHRILWSAVFVFGCLVVMGDWRFWQGVSRRTIYWLALTAIFVGLNGWLYIWAVANGHVVEASLGYFINPLVNVLFGVLLLRERLQPTQWLAVAVALLGVAYLTFLSGALPWISLTLAVSFGLYALIRKLIPIDPFRGLMIESLWLLPIVLSILLYSHQFPTGSFGLDTLIVLTGPITSIPLILFAYGARRIPLSLTGILQYIAPSMQFLLGVWWYHEPFPPAKWIGFGMIWLSLLIYTAHALLSQRSSALARDEK